MSKVSVVIPCFRCREQILRVLENVGPEVEAIYVIDDKCPELTGAFVQTNVIDPRVRVIYHSVNQGVGGAVMTGYRAANDEGMTVVVKIDGDGQMDPGLIRQFVAPILAGHADYTKGNRFFDIESVRAMPLVRLLGNAALSFLTKISSGYWHIFDPTNGYTAIHTDALKQLPLNKIAKRYFFESDILFRLNLARAVVEDVPMRAVYADEKSNLKISKILWDFSSRHLQNFAKRIFYSYFLRDFSLASLELAIGIVLVSFGGIFGAYSWWHAAASSVGTPPGTVMLAALPIIIGVQLLLGFLGFDYSAVPTRAISRHIYGRDLKREK